MPRNIPGNFPECLAGYFSPGFRFEKFEPAGSGNGKCVFLIHGWGVRAGSMAALAKELAKCGCTVYNYDYPSSKRTIAGHAEKFLELYRETLRQDKIRGGIYFLTHSMGGLILRMALAKMTEVECRNIERIVMLGPPNRGSLWGGLGRNRAVRYFNASLGDMALNKQAQVHHIPAPLHLPETGIIAGRYDGKVAGSNTRLPQGQCAKHLTVNSTHPGLRSPANTLKYILKFFQDGGF